MVGASALHSVDLDSIPLSSCSKDFDNAIHIFPVCRSAKEVMWGVNFETDWDSQD